MCVSKEIEHVESSDMFSHCGQLVACFGDMLNVHEYSLIYSEMAFRQFVSLRDVMNGATHHSRRGDDTPSGVCSLCRPEDLYTATKMLT